MGSGCEAIPEVGLSRCCFQLVWPENSDRPTNAHKLAAASGTKPNYMTSIRVNQLGRIVLALLLQQHLNARLAEMSCLL